MKKVFLVLVLFISFSAMAQDSTLVVTDTTEVTEQIADALDSLVVPIAELIADELRDAPKEGAPFTAWIGWIVGFVSLLIAFVIPKIKKKKKE